MWTIDIEEYWLIILSNQLSWFLSKVELSYLKKIVNEKDRQQFYTK